MADIVELPLRLKGMLYLGSKPGYLAFNTPLLTLYAISEYLEACEQKHIRYAVVLLTPKELSVYKPSLQALYKKHGVEMLSFPIPDFGTPEDIARFDKLVNWILGKVSHGETVLVHCGAGLGRTGLVATAVLIKVGTFGAYALQYVRRFRPYAVETPQQKAFLRDYERKYRR